MLLWYKSLSQHCLQLSVCEVFQCLPAQQNETVMPSKVKKTILPKGSSISSEKTNYLSMLHCIIFSKLMQLAMEMSACTIHCLTDMWWGCRFLAKMCTDHTNIVLGCMQVTEQNNYIVSYGAAIWQNCARVAAVWLGVCTDCTNSVSGCMQGTELLHCVIWCCSLTNLCQGCSCVTRYMHKLNLF